MGAEWSVLNHIPSHRCPPYIASVGPEPGDEPTVFFVAGDHHSETLPRNTCSYSMIRPGTLALDAERAFRVSPRRENFDWLGGRLEIRETGSAAIRVEVCCLIRLSVTSGCSSITTAAPGSPAESSVRGY